MQTLDGQASAARLRGVNAVLRVGCPVVGIGLPGAGKTGGVLSARRAERQRAHRRRLGERHADSSTCVRPHPEPWANEDSLVQRPGRRIMYTSLLGRFEVVPFDPNARGASIERVTSHGGQRVGPCARAVGGPRLGYWSVVHTIQAFPTSSLVRLGWRARTPASIMSQGPAAPDPGWRAARGRLRSTGSILTCFALSPCEHRQPWRDGGKADRLLEKESTAASRRVSDSRLGW